MRHSIPWYSENGKIIAAKAKKNVNYIYYDFGDISRRLLETGVDVLWLRKLDWDNLDGVETDMPGVELSSTSVVSSSLSASGKSFWGSSDTFCRDLLITECK